MQKSASGSVWARLSEQDVIADSVGNFASGRAEPLLSIVVIGVAIVVAIVVVGVGRSSLLFLARVLFQKSFPVRLRQPWEHRVVVRAVGVSIGTSAFANIGLAIGHMSFAIVRFTGAGRCVKIRLCELSGRGSC